MINIKNNRGITLLEVLAVLTLTALIFALATPLLINGINRYNDIHTENALRDEADLIMSKFFLEIYSLKESEIKKLSWLEPSHNSSNYYIEYEKAYTNPSTNNDELQTYTLGFKENVLYFKGESYQFSNSHIQLSPKVNSSFIEKFGDNNYRITLELYNSKKNKYTIFINEIQSINDIGGEENL